MRKRFCFALLFLIGITASVRAQIIIGSQADPHEGAVLDLRSNDNRGLLLPKVSLEAVNIFSLVDDANKVTAYGMVVYNTNAGIIGGNGVGVYFWDGTKWMPMVASTEPPIPVESIAIDWVMEEWEKIDTVIVLHELGLTEPLNVTILPADATNKNFTWKSDDTSIASVTTDGTVTGIDYGRTTITATTIDGAKTATVDVVVGCGAWAGPDADHLTWMIFQCLNLGATEGANPFIPSAAIHGAKYRYGAKEASYTQKQDQDNSGAIPGWTQDNTAPFPFQESGDWDLDTNNPCPDGWTIPTEAQWKSGAVDTSGKCWNTIKKVGTWASSANFSSGKYFGSALFLPADGYRSDDKGLLLQRGSAGHYWISDTSDMNSEQCYFVDNGNGRANIAGAPRAGGLSVRCIKK